MAPQKYQNLFKELDWMCQILQCYYSCHYYFEYLFIRLEFQNSFKRLCFTNQPTIQRKGRHFYQKLVFVIAKVVDWTLQSSFEKLANFASFSQNYSMDHFCWTKEKLLEMGQLILPLILAC